METPSKRVAQRMAMALQCFVDKCRVRYHALNILNRQDNSQVKELLEEIENMVAGSSCAYFEFDGGILHELEEQKKKHERARGSMMRVQARRESLRASACKISSQLENTLGHTDPNTSSLLHLT